MILGCLFLAWLFLPTKPEPVSTLPTDGLVEQVEGVEEFRTLLPGKIGLILHLVETANHVPDAGKKVDHSVDATKMVEPIEMPLDGLVEATQRASKTHEIKHGNETDFAIIDPQPSLSDRHEKVKLEIIIFTRPNCPPCDRWKQIEQPKFERAGWTVAYCDRHDFAITPHFLIETNGRKYENKGYLLFDKIDEVLK